MINKHFILWTLFFTLALFTTSNSFNYHLTNQTHSLHPRSALDQSIHLSLLSDKELKEGIFFHFFLAQYHQLLFHAEEEVRVATAKELDRLAFILAKIGGLDALTIHWFPLLQQCMKDPKWNVQATAVENLAPVSHLIANLEGFDYLKEKILPIIQEAIKSDNVAVQRNALESLGSLAEAFEQTGGFKAIKKDILPLIEASLNSEKVPQRRAVVKSLGKLTNALAQTEQFEKMLSTLLSFYQQGLYDSDNFVRRNTSVNLGQLVQSLEKKSCQNELKKETLSLFKKAFSDSDDSVIVHAYTYLDDLVLAFENLNIPKDLLDEKWIKEHNNKKKVLSQDKKGKSSSSIIVFEEILEDWLTFYDTLLKNKLLSTQKELAEKLGTLGDLFAQSKPTYIQQPIDLLAKEFISRKKLQKSSLSALFLVESLLNQNYPHKIPNPTETWETIVTLLNQYSQIDQPKRLFFNIPQLLSHALIREAPDIEEPILKKSYKNYFRDTRLPKRKQKPKDLLGYIILNFELSRLNLPQNYADQIRSLKRSPSFKNLLPIFDQLNKSDPFFIALIEKFTSWSHDIPQSQQGAYWGNAQIILEIISRNRTGLEQLNLWEKIEIILDFEQFKASNKRKSLQQSIEKIKKLLIFKMAEIFHFKIEKTISNSITEEEMNVLFYIIRHPNYAGSIHSVNLALRPYFRARAEGKSEEEATELYEKNIIQLNLLKENFDFLSSYLNKEKTRIATITPMEGTVHLTNKNKKLKRDPQTDKKVIISIERNPIKILHLGWPSLGNSCLDLIDGNYQKHAAAYLLNPAVQVIYIRDKSNPNKPMARISVGLDPASKTLFLLSSIYTSNTYEYRYLVERFLKAWATELNVRLFLPKRLHKPVGYFIFKRSHFVQLPKGILILYSDATKSLFQTFSRSFKGYLFTPKQKVTEKILIHPAIKHSI